MHVLIHPRSAISVTGSGAVALALVLPVLLSESWLLEAGVGVVLGLACVAAATDARTGRIPDRLVVLASAPIALVLCLESAGGHAETARGAATGLVAMATPLLLIHMASPAAMGFGDVKLAAVLGAAVGMVDARATVLALCIASGATVLVALGRRRSAMPFGPGLVFGAALSLVPFTSAAGGVMPWP